MIQENLNKMCMELTLAGSFLLSFRKESHWGWHSLITAHNKSPFPKVQGPEFCLLEKAIIQRKSTLNVYWEDGC